MAARLHRHRHLRRSGRRRELAMDPISLRGGVAAGRVDGRVVRLRPPLPFRDPRTGQRLHAAAAYVEDCVRCLGGAPVAVTGCRMPGRAVDGASVVPPGVRRRGTARRKPCWSAPNYRKEPPMTESNSSPESMLAAFDRHCPLLFSIAYRILGSVADAEGVVQEAYLRWQRASDIRSPKAYRATVGARLCLDHLRKARMRRADVPREQVRPHPLGRVPAQRDSRKTRDFAVDRPA